MTSPLDFIHKDKDVNVLIVEDEIILAMALEVGLNEMGFCVSGIETSPSKAILHAQNNCPDIILMDINLNANTTGIEAANYIWKNFKIPIIFLTSYSNDKTMNDALQSEPYGYLIKPCRDEELKASINMALHKHRYFFKNKDELKEETTPLILLENNMQFDAVNTELFVNKIKVKLTKNEKKLFEVIGQSHQYKASFQKIFTYIWREDVYDLGKLRTLIYRLRTKIQADPFENVFEQGYALKVKH